MFLWLDQGVSVQARVIKYYNYNNNCLYIYQFIRKKKGVAVHCMHFVYFLFLVLVLYSETPSLALQVKHQKLAHSKFMFAEYILCDMVELNI